MPTPMKPRNQGNATPPADKPAEKPAAPENTSAAEETSDTAVIEQETPEPAPTETAAVETAVADETAGLNDEDTGLVGQLNQLLSAFVEAVDKPGRTPEDFAESARIAQQITRFVVRTPRQPVLDRLLSFFEDNAEGVASERVYLKGVSTLSGTDQQQVTHLHTLFSDLAAKRATRVNNSQVLQVLKKQEILNFYNRKQAAIRQAG